MNSFALIASSSSFDFAAGAAYTSVADYEAGLARLAGFAGYLASTIDWLKRGRAEGYVQPKVIAANYRRILKHPNARICYLGVFTEGLCVFGMMPFVASFLQEG